MTVPRYLVGIDVGGTFAALVHGTTIAVNTVIQRNGARLGLLVTEGFRDILDIQRLRAAGSAPDARSSPR